MTTTTNWRITGYSDLRPMNWLTGKREPADELATCKRCGRLHAVVYHLLDQDDNPADVGATCAKRLAFDDGTLDDFDTAGKAARREARERDDEALEQAAEQLALELVGEAMLLDPTTVEVGAPVSWCDDDRPQYCKRPVLLDGVEYRVGASRRINRPEELTSRYRAITDDEAAADALEQMRLDHAREQLAERVSNSKLAIRVRPHMRRAMR